MANRDASGRGEVRCWKWRLQRKRKNAFRSLKIHGFTLIELLVVIAVIAILAALLLPALSRGKAQANSAACKNHLHQMGLALKMYVTDFAVYPYAFLSFDTNDTFYFWFDALERYSPLSWTNTSYHCPAYKGQVSMYGPFGSYAYNWLGTAFGALNGNSPLDDYFLGLGYVRTVGRRDNYLRALSESRVRNPARMLAIGESRLHPGELGDAFMMIGGDPAVRRYPLRHGKNYNQLCCDGHVEGLPPATLFNWRKTATRWNNDEQPHHETMH